MGAEIESIELPDTDNQDQIPDKRPQLDDFMEMNVAMDGGTPQMVEETPSIQYPKYTSGFDLEIPSKCLERLQRKTGEG